MAKKKESQKRTQEVKFKFHFLEDYRPVYTNAMWGGPNVKGELEIHFLYDRNPLPKSTTHEIQDGLVIGAPKSRIGEKDTLRFVQTGVVMTPSTAKSLYDWLGEKLKILEALPDERLQTNKD